MDHQTQTFLDLTSMADLIQLVADPRAAWLWSEDGAQVLWANAAGAGFFSALSISDLHNRASLEKSPARPHIARIAASGFLDRFSIDRLRFYRGLRVMLLTCQCKKIVLPNGSSAALLVCADKGLTSTKDPLPAFAHLIAGHDRTVYITQNGNLTDTIGTLSTNGEVPRPADGHTDFFGPLTADEALHAGVALDVSETQCLVVLENAPPENVEATEEVETAAVTGAPLVPEETADSTASDSMWVRADTIGTEDLAPDPSIDEPAALGAHDNQDAVRDHVAPEDAAPALEDVGQHFEAAPDNGSARPEDDELVPETEHAAPAGDSSTEDDTAAEAAAAAPPDEETGPDHGSELSSGPETAAAFVFQPGRRPIRFAWKMDIDQRFTFVSDEFAETLGPEAAAIVGSTWAEVAERFDLDAKGSIARALHRRDTWSGKTVDWPVTGTDLTVPVDMAALPAFDRNRRFEGYRGFGVCRTADAKPASRFVPVSPAMAAFDAGLTADTVDQVPDDLDADAPDTIAEVETYTDTEIGIDTPDQPETDAAATDLSDQLPENDVADLEPLKPDALAGNTAIGASAAVLLGSIAHNAGSQDSWTPADQQGQTGFDVDAATGNLEDAPLAVEPSDTPVVESNLEASSQALMQDRPDSGGSDQELPIDAQVEPTGISEAPEPVDANQGDEATGDDGAGALPEPHLAPAAASEPVAAPSEPAGITGPTSLNPSEIESAVKSLAKSYKPGKPPAQDLFAEDEQEAGQHDQTDVLPGDVPQEADQTVPGKDHTPQGTEAITEDGTLGQDLFDAGDDSDDHAAAGDPSPTDIREVSAALFEEPESPVDEDTASDEREFYQETAAFDGEDASDEPAEPEATPAAPVRDNVIPLATAIPRIVPVDTSGLSRPERQAFRKIAEALGARLEGDLEDWDSGETPLEDVDDLTPAAPEAGPIDPTLLDRLPIGIAIVHDREVLYGNKALLALLGYRSLKELSEAGGLEALFIDEADDLPDADGMDGEVDEPMKVRLADGGVRSVDAHMHSVPWNGSRGLMISISERPDRQTSSSAAPAAPNFFAEVRGELDSARNQIAEMDTILETATDGVLVLDDQGIIQKVNGSAEALFSANRGDMIGAPFTEFLAPESRRSAEDYLDGLSKNGVASILNDGREVLGKVPSGGLIPLFMTMGRIGGEDAVKYCAVLRDITQWKTAEEELTQAKRHAENASSQKSDFLAKISHEIRTPLNAIIGFSEVMMEERFGPIGNERYKDYLKDIRTSGSHIMSLVNDLLDLSKIEAGKLDLKFSSVSANEIINECVALMQPQANRERIIIRASLPDSVPNVVADTRSLRQIVLNLLSNAIKYNRSGGQVILSTTLEPNGEVAVRVRDTGTGMTPKQLTAALEPFRQLHTARHGGGTGLGLPLTKALVEANRAQFHIDSVPDQGTLVEITFPTQRVLSE